MIKLTEDEQMVAGLDLARDPLRIASLLKQKKEDLADHVHVRMRHTALDMMDQGRYFHAIKKLCVHGEWEDFVDERKWGWDYVRCCMRLTVVAVWLPEILNVPPGRVTQMLLHFPKPLIKEILEGLSPEAIETLTVRRLDALHRKKKEELRKGKSRKPMTPEREAANLAEIEDIKKRKEDKEWEEVSQRWALAVVAMQNLVGACRKVTKWKTEYVIDALQKQMVTKLGDPWDEVVRHLHPIEEMRRLGHDEDSIDWDEELKKLPSIDEILKRRQSKNRAG